MCETPAYGGNVPDPNGGHPMVRVGKQGPGAADFRVLFQRAMSHRGADAQRAVGHVGPLELRNATQAHQVVRQDQPLLHEQRERGAASDRPAIVLMLVEQVQRLIER